MDTVRTRTIHDVIKTIADGEFYVDYDQSSADLGILRDHVKSHEADCNKAAALAYETAQRAISNACDDDNSIDEAIVRYTLATLTPDDAKKTLDDLIAEAVKAERARCIAAMRSSSENLKATFTKRNGDPKLRFDTFEVVSELKSVVNYYIKAVEHDAP